MPPPAILRRIQERDRLRQAQVRRLSSINRERKNPLDVLPDHIIFEKFRFKAINILPILTIVSPYLPPMKRCYQFSHLHQLLIFLRYLACGSFYHVMSEIHPKSSKATVCRIIHRVAAAINRNAPNVIKWTEDLRVVKSGFFEVAGMPNVIGCIDCTHINIKPPKDNEFEYVDRHGMHSLNVQVVCDQNLKAVNVIVKYPGSVHDARIFRESQLKEELSSGRLPGVLLGDSGYALEHYLLTPFANATRDFEVVFNNHHCQTRVYIERYFGILKNRFPALLKGLRVLPERAIPVILAAIVLNNIARDHSDSFVDVDVNPDSVEDPDLVMDLNEGNARARALRNAIVMNL